ncbi:hypothetical protein BGW37DRAFT_217438 [Umbelopsis sp. PMI_123]|nr:hypothetical protein BGW37DRAFT_217438 [Umbelopsis sp. PMI_123]
MALQLHGQKFKNGNIQVFSDNITALKYARKAGVTASAILLALALNIEETINQYDLRCRFSHIAGVKNVRADQLSLLPPPVDERALPRKWVSEDTNSLDQLDNRCICIEEERQTEKILESPTRRNGRSSRCLPPTMAQKGSVPPPAMATNPKSAEKTQRRQGEVSSDGNPILADTILVAPPIDPKSRQTVEHTAQQQMKDDRMELIKRYQEETGLT